jgi:2-amino-4-hydroxy-6-hydroxymethyldihydropteridine diphosphokinase
MKAEFVMAYLCLGSNLGDRKENIKKALNYLSQKLRVTMKSSIYDTEPVGNSEQPRFLNLVCQVKTMLSAVDLLVLVKGIERKMGRIPSRPNSPRPIDIDILFFGDQVINSPELIIPHPRLVQRAFVLVPLVEIDAAKVHPVNNKTAGALLKELKHGAQGVLRLE